ncbi:MAG: glycosyltransferase family 39 protein [Candidatus Aenigmatarchaeota archaeon]|nr:MAG: glycosyltransferase family 39 protein [Candidatus Aenigmarchaeota archaeon]
MRLEIKDKLHVLLFVIILILSIGFRLVYLDQPMKHDEAATFNNFASKSMFQISVDYYSSNNHIFHSIFVHLSYLLFGKDEIFIRFPAFIFGILSILSIYFLARKILDRNVALLSMLLLSVSQFFINYSSEARGYTLAVFLSILTVYFIFEALKTEKLKFWLISAVLVSLTMYTIPSMFYFFLGISVWVIFVKAKKLSRNQKFKNPLLFLLLSGFITTVLYMPILIFTGINLISPLSNIYVSPFIVTFDEFITKSPLYAIETIETFSLGITSYVFLVVFVLLGYYFLYKEKSYDKLILFLSLPIITILAIIIQMVLPPIRIFIFLLPFFCMLVAKGILNLVDFVVSLRDIFSKYQLNKILPILILIVFLIQGVSANLLTEKHFPHDSEEAAEWLKANLRTGDSLLVYSSEDEQIKYYTGQEVYSQYENIKSNVSRIVMVVNPSKHEQVDEFVEYKFQIRGASEFELLKKIGRLDVYQSTKLEFIYTEEDCPGVWIYE